MSNKKRIAKRLRSSITHRYLGSLAPKYKDGNRLGLHARLRMAGAEGLEKYIGEQVNQKLGIPAPSEVK